MTSGTQWPPSRQSQDTLKVWVSTQQPHCNLEGSDSTAWHSRTLASLSRELQICKSEFELDYLILLTTSSCSYWLKRLMYLCVSSCIVRPAGLARGLPAPLIPGVFWNLFSRWPTSAFEIRMRFPGTILLIIYRPTWPKGLSHLLLETFMRVV